MPSRQRNLLPQIEYHYMAVGIMFITEPDSECVDVAGIDSSSRVARDCPGLARTLTYTAFVLPGNGASLFQSCLQTRHVWRVHVRGVDEQSAWHLWWGSNGQACPFKRLRTGMVIPFSRKS